jgi:holo-ACP synthase/triphosphoribosyl-dephospho-CoA synthase
LNAKTEAEVNVRRVSLEEVLALREGRARRREELSRSGLSLACLTLNIPGEYKVFPLAVRSFHEESAAFTRALRAEGVPVVHRESWEDPAGPTEYVSAAAPPEKLKAIALALEGGHPLGRLFDIDVFAPGGRKLSRGGFGEAERPCLVCGGGAFACGRSRAHPAAEVMASVLKIMEGFLREKAENIAGSAAAGALMGEVAVTPKPGLVDRANSGAHRDMDFFTFIDSAAAILPFFRECARRGFDRGGSPHRNSFAGEEDSENLTGLFESLRPAGKIAEEAMREASGGPNTHRGAIFSLGIISAAYGYLYRSREKPGLEALLGTCRLMTGRLGEDFSRPPRSHGEVIYAAGGVRGVRGEASRGFPAVRDHAYPALRGMLGRGYSLNDAGIAAFLQLLAHTEDTNIIHRAGEAALRRIREETARFLGTNPGMEEMRAKAADLDKEFTARNISPGGCADLLGVTIFLYRLLR